MTQNISVETLLQQGYDQLDRGQEKAALETFQQAATLEPQNPQILYALGLTYYRLERYQISIDYLTQALQIQPTYILALARQGMSYQELNQQEQAKEDFEQAIEIEPQNYEDWRGRGLAFNELKRYEEALASYDKAIKIKPDDNYAWHGQGNVLCNLCCYKEALASYDEAIKINPYYHHLYHNKGNVLCDLYRYEEALASFNKAIEIHPDYHNVWHGRGNALYGLGRYKEAIDSYNEAIKIKHDFWKVLKNRGLCYYNRGQQQQQPINQFSDWRAAKDDYKQALKLLKNQSLQEQQNYYLPVLQNLIQVSNKLSAPNNQIQALFQEGTDTLDSWLQNPQLSVGEKIKLQRRFAGFNQTRVDTLAQSKDPAQQVQALELAEQRKNTCISWLRQNNFSTAPNLPYSQMQKLLNPDTAAIYWHVSAAAITTFIIKHDRPPLVLSPQSPPQIQQQLVQQKPYPADLYQLNRFQNWMQKWKQSYQNYLDGKEAHWRQKIEKFLNQLRDILEINRIKDEYLGNFRKLILIPHRQLHLLPLHALFPPGFTITYLPSFQIGLSLQHKPTYDQKIPSLLNVENPRNDLPFATIESVVISHLYPQSRQIEVAATTQPELIAALQNNTGHFHFTGHGYHEPEEPRKSALELAESDKLTLGDIFDRNLILSQYQLVCLSACETGITSQDNLLDEYVGFVSGFLYKEVSYVISTLWTVDERSAALLMIRFYQLLKQAHSPATALKDAQYWLLNLTYKDLAQWYRQLAGELNPSDTNQTNYAFRHCSAYLETEAQIIEADQAKMESRDTPYTSPYHWAGFILTGKPN